MNIQELEHNQHVEGCQSELQNLLTQSRGEVPKVSEKYVAWLSSIGFYVVLEFVQQYCQWTDAPSGTGEFIALITRSADEVDDYVEFSKQFAEYGEYCKVIPPEPTGEV